MNDSFHNRSQVRYELDEWLEEYYMACISPHTEVKYREEFTRKQYMFLKCIYWVMNISKRPDEKLTYADMYNDLKGLMHNWDKSIDQSHQNPNHKE